MAQPVDPIARDLTRDLRAFRKAAGVPTPARMAGLFTLTEILGNGIPERAYEELLLLGEKLGTNAESGIGAFFYLSGHGVGLDSVDQRRNKYRDEFYVDISTALPRSERGIQELVTIIRDRDESFRPWAFVSVFQSRSTFQPVLDFNLGHETWSAPQVFINDEEVQFDFHVHKNPKAEDSYTRRIVLPESPLDVTVGFGEPMALVRVVWTMPVWPVWSVMSWTADPRIMTHLRTFRERAVEVSLQWWRETPASELEGLVSDGAIWAERRDPSTMNLPDGWHP